jgi:hypothetical protein
MYSNRQQEITLDILGPQDMQLMRRYPPVELLLQFSFVHPHQMGQHSSSQVLVVVVAEVQPGVDVAAGEAFAILQCHHLRLPVLIQDYSVPPKAEMWNIKYQGRCRLSKCDYFVSTTLCLAVHPSCSCL